MLVVSTRPTSADLRAWTSAERADAVHATLPSFRARVDRAERDVAAFVLGGPCYSGVSWGKDSVVVADILARTQPHVPLLWVRVEPIANPDCDIVRDAFLRMHPHVRYDEIEIRCLPRQRDCDGWSLWDARGTLETGFALAVERHGDRYVSGIRGEESGGRKKRMSAFGVSTARTCAPIGYWKAEDVFAYLYSRELPVHPAYACSMGGTLDRRRLRVAALGGGRGTGHGRRVWEAAYYPAETRALFGGRPSEGVL